MPRLLVINGPNLNMLGNRNADNYGSKTLAEIDQHLRNKADGLGIELESFQTNHEGAIIDCIQAHFGRIHAIIINPGAFTHYSYAIRDALEDSQVPVVEVHLSDIHSREEWRRHSVIAPVTIRQITGRGWQGYIEAIDVLAAIVNKEAEDGQSLG